MKEAASLLQQCQKCFRNKSDVRSKVYLSGLPILEYLNYSQEIFLMSGELKEYGL